MSKYDAWSGTSVVQLPFHLTWRGGIPFQADIKGIETSFFHFTKNTLQVVSRITCKWLTIKSCELNKSKRPILPPCSSPHGNTDQVEKSGYKTMSLSSRRTKPSIEEPSKRISLVNTLSNWLVGTSTAFSVPLISVKHKRKKSYVFVCYFFSNFFCSILFTHSFSTY